MRPTQRLTFRRWREDDAETLLALTNDDSVASPCGWLPNENAAQCAEVIREIYGAEDAFAIVLKDSNEIIGHLSLMPPRNSGDGEELGYWIGKDHWGHGYMTEAAREALRYAFEEKGLEAVWCAYFEGNERSASVQRKCGFRFHDREEDMILPFRGEHRASIMNRLTRYEWLEQFVRPMTEADRQEVLTMMRVFYDSPAVLTKSPDRILERDFEDCIGSCPFVEGLILTMDGRTAGYSMLAHSYSTEFGGECLWIEDLYIKPEYRSQHLGTRYFEYLHSHYPAVRFRLEAEPENTIAVALYEKSGYAVLPYTQMTRETEE